MDQSITHTREKNSTSNAKRSGTAWRRNDCNSYDSQDTNDFTQKNNDSVLGRKKLSDPSVEKVPVVVQDVLQSPGNSLDQNTLTLMESHFGYNFRNVRVHDDTKAAESAKSVNAVAYTVGKDVVFGAGQYAPSKNHGRQVLAHELTHVVQQSSLPVHKENLRIGEPGSYYEKEAENHATQLVNPGGKIRNNKISTLGAGYGVLQRQVAGVPNLLAPLNVSSDEITIGDGENISPENPKLVQLAGAFRQKALSAPGGFIKLSSYLSEAAKLSSARQTSEATRLQQRMSAIRGALIKLGVPESGIQIESPTAFSAKDSGQVMADLYKPSASTFPIMKPGPIAGNPVLPSVPTSATPSLSEMLSFHFKAGAFELDVALPKSIAIKLPVHIKASKTLSFELKAESSGTFSFSVSLNGLPHLNVSAKVAGKVDKDKGTSGSLGLEITATKTVCSAPSPESLKASIIAAGEKLTKAGKEWTAAKPEDKLSRLVDIGGAIGEMYDAVDKSKSACKEVPRVTFNLGFQGPISPSDSFVNDPDPLKRPASVLGGSLSFPF